MLLCDHVTETLFAVPAGSGHSVSCVSSPSSGMLPWATPDTHAYGGADGGAGTDGGDGSDGGDGTDGGNGAEMHTSHALIEPVNA